MNRCVLLCIVCFAICVATLLFRTSQMVQSEERAVYLLKRSIENERVAMRVLKAEWGYLNNPYHLATVTERLSDLHLPKPAQIVSDLRAVPSAPMTVHLSNGTSSMSISPNQDSHTIMQAIPASYTSSQAVPLVVPVGKPAVRPPQKPHSGVLSPDFEKLLYKMQREKAGGVR